MLTGESRGQIAIGGRVREFKSAIAHGSADYLVGGLEHFFLHRTRIPTDEHIFRGVEATNQLYYIYMGVCVYGHTLDEHLLIPIDSPSPSWPVMVELLRGVSVKRAVLCNEGYTYHQHVISTKINKTHLLTHMFTLW